MSPLVLTLIVFFFWPITLIDDVVPYTACDILYDKVLLIIIICTIKFLGKGLFKIPNYVNWSDK